MKRRNARRVVDAVLNALWCRRPFKHDLARMEERYPELWAEMMRTMEDAVRETLRARRTKR